MEEKAKAAKKSIPIDRITMRELAQEVGASVSSISRAFSGDPGVGDKLRLRILKRARELRYTPSAVASQLRRIKTTENTLKILLTMGTPPVNPISQWKLEAILAEASRRGYNAIPQYMTGDAEEAIRELCGDSPTGCVLWCPDSQWLNAAEHWLLDRIPTVIFDTTYLTHGRFDSVEIARNIGSYQAMRLLSLTGVTTVAVLGDMGSRLASKNAGIELATERHQLSVVNVPLLTLRGDFCEAGYRTVLRMLESTQPEAIFAINDYVAMGALRAIAESGMSVPQDIKVVGFDNSLVAPYTSPPLTTVSQPVEQAVRKLFDVLEQRMDQKSGLLIQETVRTSLVIRQSAPASTVKIRSAVFEDAANHPK
jgi:LacI family transcriptional regulator